MELNAIRKNILELTSEDAYGSWEFWSTNENKTEAEANYIAESIAKLVEEGKLVALEHKSQGPYIEVSFDFKRLQAELQQSIQPYNVNPDTFYWFSATEAGKEEDKKLRAN